MGKLLLLGGSLFLLLGIVLMLVALIMFLARRKKSAPVAAVGAPSAPAGAPVRTGPMPMVNQPAAASPSFSPSPTPQATTPSFPPPIAPPGSSPIAPPAASFDSPLAPPIAPPMVSFEPPVAPPIAPPAAPGLSSFPASTPDPTVFVDMSAKPGWGSLRCIAGPLSGQIVPLDEKGVMIGRDRNSAQIILEDPRVSKRHVWVGVRNGAVTAVDSSTNGTFLNTIDHRISETPLRPGDVLIVSQDVARFEYQS